jgi:hypothetical protein
MRVMHLHHVSNGSKQHLIHLHLDFPLELLLAQQILLLALFFRP